MAKRHLCMQRWPWHLTFAFTPYCVDLWGFQHEFRKCRLAAPEPTHFLPSSLKFNGWEACKYTAKDMIWYLLSLPVKSLSFAIFTRGSRNIRPFLPGGLQLLCFCQDSSRDLKFVHKGDSYGRDSKKNTSIKKIMQTRALLEKLVKNTGCTSYSLHGLGDGAAWLGWQDDTILILWEKFQGGRLRRIDLCSATCSQGCNPLHLPV